MSVAKSLWCGLFAVAVTAIGVPADDTGLQERVQRAIGKASGAQVSVNDPYQFFPAVLTTYLWNGGWDASTRGTATRVGGQVVNVLLENHFGSDWANSAMIELSYSSADGPDTVTTSLWQTVLWLLSNRTIYTYEGDGRVGEEIYQVYYQGAWQDNGRTIYTYDVSGNLIQELRQNWQGGWTNQSRTVYTYSGSDLTMQVESIWMGSSWSEIGRTTYTYSGGKQVEELYESGFGGTWQAESRTTTAYNGDLVETETEEVNYGGGWENSTRTIYES